MSEPSKHSETSETSPNAKTTSESLKELSFGKIQDIFNKYKLIINKVYTDYNNRVLFIICNIQECDSDIVIYMSNKYSIFIKGDKIKEFTDFDRHTHIKINMTYKKYNGEIEDNNNNDDKEKIDIEYEKYRILKDNILKNKLYLETIKQCVKNIKYKLILISDSNINYISKNKVKSFFIKDKSYNSSESVSIYPLIKFDFLFRKEHIDISYDIKLFNTKLEEIIDDNNNMLIDKLEKKNIKYEGIKKYIEKITQTKKLFKYYLNEFKNVNTDKLNTDLYNEYKLKIRSLKTEYMKFIIYENVKLFNTYEKINDLIEYLSFL